MPPTPRTNRTRRVFLLIGGGLCLCAATWILYLGLSDRQPVYEGKPLLDWVEQASSPKAEERLTAERAVRAIGADALPALVWCLGVRESVLDQAILDAENRLPSAVWRFLYRRTKPHEAAQQRVWAAHALALLGPEAEAALPALAMVLDDPAPAVRSAAATAMRSIGPACAPALIEALDRLADSAKGPVIVALSGLCLSTNGVASALVRVACLTESDQAALQAIQALQHCGDAAVVPVVNAFESVEPAHRDRLVAAVAQVAGADYSAYREFVVRSRVGPTSVRLGTLEGLAHPRNPYGATLAMVRAIGDEEEVIRDLARQWLLDHESPASLQRCLDREPEDVRRRVLEVFP